MKTAKSLIFLLVLVQVCIIQKVSAARDGQNGAGPSNTCDSKNMESCEQHCKRIVMPIVGVCSQSDGIGQDVKCVCKEFQVSGEKQICDGIYKTGCEAYCQGIEKVVKICSQVTREDDNITTLNLCKCTSGSVPI